MIKSEKYRQDKKIDFEKNCRLIAADLSKALDAD